jgi:hypothetical protein
MYMLPACMRTGPLSTPEFTCETPSLRNLSAHACQQEHVQPIKGTGPPIHSLFDWGSLPSRHQHRNSPVRRCLLETYLRMPANRSMSNPSGGQVLLFTRFSIGVLSTISGCTHAAHTEALFTAVRSMLCTACEQHSKSSRNSALCLLVLVLPPISCSAPSTVCLLYL